MTLTDTNHLTSPPQWFTDALAAPVEDSTVQVEGVDIAFRAFGNPGPHGLVLVHGGAAHSRWWDHIAPLLARDRRVVALDLSGHGDSGRRERYSMDTWADEVLAVAEAAGITAPPIVIGHSMGGFVTLQAAHRFGTGLAGALAIDSPIRDVTPEERAARDKHAFTTHHTYESREQILRRFRPLPDQPTLPYVAEHIAATSIREADGRWSWKFDPYIFSRGDVGAAPLARVDCRVALFRAEHGIVPEPLSALMYDRLGRVAPLIEIPAAGHHIMLDQPLALVTAIRTLLSDWDHSLPSAG